eukprot:m.343465 g.343465  ORF g.343465 m.343465 type:complete len:260 (+) comp20631_c0_seq28:372-1151(+)
MSDDDDNIDYAPIPLGVWLEVNYLEWVTTTLTFLGFGIVFSQLFPVSIYGVKIGKYVAIVTLAVSMILLTSVSIRYHFRFQRWENNGAYQIDWADPAILTITIMAIVLVPAAIGSKSFRKNDRRHTVFGGDRHPSAGGKSETSLIEIRAALQRKKRLKLMQSGSSLNGRRNVDHRAESTNGNYLTRKLLEDTLDDISADPEEAQACESSVILQWGTQVLQENKILMLQDLIGKLDDMTSLMLERAELEQLGDRAHYLHG